MKRLAKAAVITRLRDRLERSGSWCGETHMQKATYFLQEAAHVPLGFEFVLYKHGPFSFDLRDELTGFRGDGLLDLKVDFYPYGPRLTKTDLGERLQEKFPKTLTKYDDRVELVASFIGPSNVSRLERLATALMLLRKSPDADDLTLAREMCAIKPHVAEEAARAAVAEVRKFLEEHEAEFRPAPAG